MFKPMLACNADLNVLRYPVLASPKLDGVRAAVVGGKLLTRTLKEVPNRHIFTTLSRLEYEGFDGELIVGYPTDTDVYRNTVSGVMRIAGEPKWTWYVFDDHAAGGAFSSRYASLTMRVARARLRNTCIHTHEHKQIRNADELEAYETECVNFGYEGLILRDPDASYKHGRSTVLEAGMLKVKRFEDSEAVVLDVVEEMFNGNDAKTNELGRTKRSSAKAGLVGKGTMGALKVRDVKTDAVFHIGTGFTAADRAALWAQPPIGKLAKYKFFAVGVKDLPRHPVFLGWRDRRDL